MSATKKTTFVEGIGRRKTATARVRLTPATNTEITINGKALNEFFGNESQQSNVQSVLKTENAGIEDYTITVKVIGGGISAQAEAIRLGIARALVKEKSSRRSPLKISGFLKRDPRSVERKKFGLRKARKQAAWSKR
ncbi:30S ribosomal protein S9 [Candidatus Kaiserbacteria bacterium]|nr:30S ribosomal protein S9 [Candidatus Kaiserbacteria bacterium]USN92092.1 MAG: 30S ribosomal protein S9 [Candidatus Nomurabacteria bacterium]